MSSYLIWDARRVYRDRLVELVSQVPGINRIDATGATAELLATYRTRQPDVVVVGTQRAVRTGTEVLHRLVGRHPRAGVVVVGAGDDQETVRISASAGALGYLRWEDVAAAVTDPTAPQARATMVLLSAAVSFEVRGASMSRAGPTASSGAETDDSPSSATRCLASGSPTSAGGAAPSPPATSLTERETQVLRGMSLGLSNPEIGAQLYLSTETVKTHARRLFAKLGALDRSHAVACGFRLGVLP